MYKVQFFEKYFVQMFGEPNKEINFKVVIPAQLGKLS